MGIGTLIGGEVFEQSFEVIHKELIFGGWEANVKYPSAALCNPEAI